MKYHYLYFKTFSDEITSENDSCPFRSFSDHIGALKTTAL